MWRQDYLFKLIAQGERVSKIEEEINNNPKKNFYSVSDKEHVLNAPSVAGHTPLYVAGSNGHLHLVKYFLEAGSDPHIWSNVTRSKTENNLEVVVRWGHIRIVDYYLEHIEWSKIEIKEALKHKQAPIMVRNQLKVYGKEHFGCCFPTF